MVGKGIIARVICFLGDIDVCYNNKNERRKCMRKGNVKKMVATTVVGAFLLGNLVAFAASNLQEVKAWINYDLKMKLNGKTFAPTEADGTSIRPLTYNNRTYLPVSALGNALGVAIGWDDATKTVIIGEGDKVTDLSGIIPDSAYHDNLGWQYTKNKELLYAGGKTFDSGWILKSFLLMLLLIFLRFLFDYLRARFQESISYELIARDRLAVGDALKRVSLGYFQTKSTGTILNAITTGLHTLENMGIRMIDNFVGGYLNFTCIFLWLMFINWKTGLIA